MRAGAIEFGEIADSLLPSLLPRIGPIGPLGSFPLKSPVFSGLSRGPVPGPISANLQ